MRPLRLCFQISLRAGTVPGAVLTINIASVFPMTVSCPRLTLILPGPRWAADTNIINFRFYRDYHPWTCR